jgi:quinol-cytochrome oxidoreductase complex cytochrome b subunit/cytochrome c
MHSTEEQSSRQGAWDQRTGWSLLKQTLFLEPLPGGSRWAAAFGSLLLFAFVLQVVTGILLATSYAPSVDSAWASVNYIQNDAPGGAFIRALHHWGSSAMVILLLMHLLQVFVWGAYKKPRELTWMVGVLLLVCTLGLAFTGYLLPWDQKAYWATKVGLGILSTTPGIGDSLRTMFQGGPEMGNLTLTRFFALHGFLLPGLVILLVVVHLYLFRLHGVTPGWWQSPNQLRAQEEPFWPKQALKDGILALVFLVGLGVWASNNPAPLEAQADPSQPYEARPEWYFMFLFQALRYFHGPYEIVGTFVLPTTFFLVLFFWPWLDRNPQRNPARRPVAIGLLGLSTAALIGLTVFAIATDVRMKEPEQVVAKAATTAPEPAGPIQRADVAKVYSENCASCHGIDGSGKQIRAGMPTIPDLTSLAWQMSQTDMELTHRIEDGNPPLMPAYRDKLSRNEILALSIYVRAFAIEVGKPPELVREGPAPPVKEPPPPPVSQMTPTQLYRAYCLSCHDTDGKGTLMRKGMPDIPDFTDPKWQSAQKDPELVKSLLDGKGKFMSPMKDKIGVSDAEKLVALVRGFPKSGPVETAPTPIAKQPETPAIEPKPAPPRLGKEPGPLPEDIEKAAARTRVATTHYRQYCLSCHGVDGRGEAAMRPAMRDLPDFTARSWQDAVTNAQLTAGILDGKGTLMPAFRGRISEFEAQDLTAYIRAFGPTRKPTEPGASDFEKRFRQLEEEMNEWQKQLRELQRPPRKP